MPRMITLPGHVSELSEAKYIVTCRHPVDRRSHTIGLEVIQITNVTSSKNLILVNREKAEVASPYSSQVVVPVGR